MVLEVLPAGFPKKMHWKYCQHDFPRKCIGIRFVKDKAIRVSYTPSVFI
jgi:hypothetical protein